MPDQGDIVLVPVPFTDLSSEKRRPVVVISNNDYNRTTVDILVVAMTSNPTAGLYSIPIASSDLERGSLNRPSIIRVDKAYTLSQSIVVKTLGRVKPDPPARIRALLAKLTEPLPPL